MCRVQSLEENGNLDWLREWLFAYCTDVSANKEGYNIVQIVCVLTLKISIIAMH